MFTSIYIHIYVYNYIYTYTCLQLYVHIHMFTIMHNSYIHIYINSIPSGHGTTDKCLNPKPLNTKP